MLDQYSGECMGSIININNGIKKPLCGYQNYIANQILMFGGFVKMREPLYTRFIIRVKQL